MKQVWRTLLAIFAPLGSLVRVLDVILTWADEIDSLLHDPDLSPDFHTDEGRRTLEGQIAYGEHWVNILTAARTAELLGLRRTARFDMAWSFWRPHTPCSWDSLMQRYQRMRMSFAAIECNAQRRAAQQPAAHARQRRPPLAGPLPSAALAGTGLAHRGLRAAPRQRPEHLST